MKTTTGDSRQPGGPKNMKPMPTRVFELVEASGIDRSWFHILSIDLEGPQQSSAT